MEVYTKQQWRFGGLKVARFRPYIILMISSLPPLQVLQFGKIDSGSFILDFQAPFSPVQAFATALANLV